MAGRPGIQDRLRAETLFGSGLFWFPQGSLRHARLPEHGLGMVTEFFDPCYAVHRPGIPWDAPFEAPGGAPPLRRSRGLPPPSFAAYCRKRSAEWGTALCYYSIEMHGGETLHESAWVFADQFLELEYAGTGVFRIWRDGDAMYNESGDLLRYALARVGIELKRSGWFEPFAGAFDWKRYRLAAASEADPARPSFFPTSLHWSVESGDIDAVKRNLAAGADPNAYSNSILEPALNNRDAGTLRVLLKHGAKIDRGLRNPLRYAIDAESAGLLIAAGALVRDRPNPLIGALTAGDEETVRFMISKGAAVEATDADLWFAACSGGVLKIMKQLLRHRDAVQCGQNGFEFAAENDRVAAMELLMNEGAEVRPGALALAAEKGAMNAALWLLDRAQVDVNSTHYSDTPLYAASRGGHLEMVRLLLQRGADPQGAGPGEMALHVAVSYGHDAVIDVLLGAGVSINVGDDQGRTPLWSAVGSGDQALVDRLIAMGARTDVTNAYGGTLHELAACRDIVLP